MENEYLYNSEDRFNQLIRKNGGSADLERKVLFFTIAGNDELYLKVNHIYDFTEKCIKPECLEYGTADFSSGTRKLLILAFNLFNGCVDANVLHIFSSLDRDNFELAIQALRMRFAVPV